MNVGLASAKRRAEDRSAWWKFVSTAMSSHTRYEEKTKTPLFSPPLDTKF